MPPRCPNGTRRNRKSGNCEPSTKSPKNKTVKAKASPVVQSFSDICKIASELYGLSYIYFYRSSGEIRTLYHRHKMTGKPMVFPRNLKTVMIGTPSEKWFVRTPYTGKATKNKSGISAKAVVKDMTRADVFGTTRI